MRKYDATHDGKAKEQQHQHLEQELRNSMVLFRAQRNFYITGFSLFLVLYAGFDTILFKKILLA
jgi:B-cell receptor-associated protein 31